MERRELLQAVLLKEASAENKIQRALHQAQMNRQGFIYGSRQHRARTPNLRVVEIEFEKQGLTPLFVFYDGRFLCYDNRRKTFVVYNVEDRERGESSPDIYQLLRK